MLRFFLAELGINVNSCNAKGQTRFWYPCKVRAYDNIKFLLEVGAEVSKADFPGKTPLHYAYDGVINLSYTAR
jgi:ankyrin repeat protein